jgi:transcriptional regulator with XRE-family HTH domain
MMPKTPNLRAVREARLLSQTELAERAGLTQASVSHLERGRSAQGSTVRKLARALRVRPAKLLANDGSRVD